MHKNLFKLVSVSVIVLFLMHMSLKTNNKKNIFVLMTVTGMH